MAVKPLKRYNTLKLIYQLKISLCIDERDEFEPKIWRQIQIPFDYTFDRLNDVIRLTMNWTKNHKHKFIVIKSPKEHLKALKDIDNYCAVANEGILVNKYLNLIDKHLYYHYNDNWEHELELQCILPVEVGVEYPRCIAGEGVAPPDDCTVDTFCELIEIVTDPHHVHYYDVVDRFGWFDPDGFCVDDVNVKFRLSDV